MHVHASRCLPCRCRKSNFCSSAPIGCQSLARARRCLHRRPVCVKAQQASDIRQYSNAQNTLLCTAKAALLSGALLCLPAPANAVSLTEVHAAASVEAAAGKWGVLAGLFDFGREDDAPPTAPFTASGQTSKKYLIEQKDGEKIVSRKQGVTTLTCLRTAPLVGDKNFPSDQFQTCIKAEAAQVAPACASSCQQACTTGIGQYTSFSQSFSGFASAPEDVERAVKGCTRRCVYECKKPGDGYEFVVTSRR